MYQDDDEFAEELMEAIMMEQEDPSERVPEEMLHKAIRKSFYTTEFLII